MNKSTVRELIEKALAKQLTFPQIPATLGHSGVESYHVDFLRNEFRCYSSKGKSLVTTAPLAHAGVAREFSAEKLDVINKRVQSGEWSFADFVRESTARAVPQLMWSGFGRISRWLFLDKKATSLQWLRDTVTVEPL